ncbi:MAG: LLM class flavin-dependent oxidoreductase [Acidimicrobiales bacterium]
MKVRIGIGTGAAGLGGGGLAQLAHDLVAAGFDSLWLPEILTAPGLDPLVGLAWAAAAEPALKIGTTMLLPGRNPVRLAGQIGALDALSGGRFLVTFVPGLPGGPEAEAVGIPVAERGAAMDEILPLLLRLWSGEAVSYDGPTGSFHDVTVTPCPVQDPFEVWLGGTARASLERCGRLADGWLPSLLTPADAVAGRRVLEEAAAAAGRTISSEHFGASIGYAREPLDDRQAAGLSRRARGRPLDDLVPVGLDALADLVARFVTVGFSKFVVRPLVAPDDWRAELDDLAGAVGHLQT